MSAMLSQNADKDFFCMNVKEQKELLDRILSLNHITSLQVLLNESVKYYKDVAELIETYTDGVKSQKKVVEQKYVDELNELCEEVDRVSTNVTQLWNGWNMIPERRLISISNVDEFASELAKKETRLASLPSDGVEKVTNRISEINRDLVGLHMETMRFHMFNGLNKSSMNAIGSIESKKDIEEYEDLLRMHPYYGSKDLYEDI
jgi:DNA repair exonuclease SbcCD ATPase subunit